MMNVPGRICASCGEYVPPEQKECPRCHTVAVEAALPASLQMDVSAPVLPTSYPNYPPYPAYPAYPPTSATPGTPYPFVMPDGAYPPYFPPPQRRSVTKRVWFICIGVLVVLLVAGSLFFTLASRTNATVTVASGTPTATPTLVAPPDNPALVDDFTDNTNQWWIGEKTGYGAEIAHHALTMHEGNGKNFLEYVPGSQGWNDYRLDITYVLPQQEPATNYIAIFFRNQAALGKVDLSQGYRLIIENNGHYLLRKYTVTSSLPGATNLAAGTLGVLPESGKPIAVTLIIRGSTMMVYFNNRLAISYTDDFSPFHGGHLDLITANTLHAAPEIVNFTHVAAYVSSFA